MRNLRRCTTWRCKCVSARRVLDTWGFIHGLFFSFLSDQSTLPVPVYTNHNNQFLVRWGVCVSRSFHLHLTVCVTKQAGWKMEEKPVICKMHLQTQLDSCVFTWHVFFSCNREYVLKPEMLLVSSCCSCRFNGIETSTTTRSYKNLTSLYRGTAAHHQIHYICRSELKLKDFVSFFPLTGNISVFFFKIFWTFGLWGNSEEVSLRKQLFPPCTMHTTPALSFGLQRPSVRHVGSSLCHGYWSCDKHCFVLIHFPHQIHYS